MRIVSGRKYDTISINVRDIKTSGAIDKAILNKLSHLSEVEIHSFGTRTTDGRIIGIEVSWKV